MIDTKKIEAALGYGPTEKGNFLLGQHDAGYRQPPGGSFAFHEVGFFLLSDGEFRAVIDSRSGSNQGYLEAHDGEVIRMDGTTLSAVIEAARQYINGLVDPGKLPTALHIAGNEAEKEMRKIEGGPLSVFSTDAIRAELARREGATC